MFIARKMYKVQQNAKPSFWIKKGQKVEPENVSFRNVNAHCRLVC